MRYNWVNIMTRDYCGAYTYRNGSIERIMMGNGFMQDSAYYVQVKDYQGNVRSMPATPSSSLTSTAQKNSTARTAYTGMTSPLRCSELKN